MKKIFTCILAGLLIVTLSSCGKKPINDEQHKKEQDSSNKKVSVIVSFNPLKEFAEAIGGDKVKVQTVIPQGTEPHSFEPKAKDMEELEKGKIFVYSGLGMEKWVDKILKLVKNKDLLVVEASENCNALKNVDEGEIKEHGQYDPHIWLSLKEAATMSENIKNALIKINPENKEYYNKNYRNFKEELNKLYEDYMEKLKNVNNKSFVTGHAAFGYLCRDFGLEQNSVEDMFAEGEPSPKKLKEITDYCKEKNIKTIFLEEMVSPKVSETLAREVDGKVEKIYTIASREDNRNYIESMRYNLEKIYSSLK